MLPGWHQAIIWTNAGISLIGPWGRNSSDIFMGIQTFSFKKMHLKMLSAKWRPFCHGLNVLILHWQCYDAKKLVYWGCAGKFEKISFKGGILSQSYKVIHSITCLPTCLCYWIKHIEVRSKLLTLSKQYCGMYFLEANNIVECIFLKEDFCILIWICLKLSLGSIWRVNVGLGNGLAPNRWQAITWTNVDPSL